MKICTKCKDEKDFNLFSNNKNYKDGKDNICKKCHKEYDQLNRDKQLKYHKEKRKNELDKFKAYDKEYNLKNKERYKQEYILNKEKYQQRNKIYNSKPEVKERKNQKIRERRKNDPLFKIKENLRIRLYKSIKLNKSVSALTLIGCSIPKLKQYLESLFLPEMSWENHGIIWEIDHIIPCSSFDLTILKEQQKCFHYSNLQPLFKTTKIAESFGYLEYIGNRNKGDQIL